MQPPQRPHYGEGAAPPEGPPPPFNVTEAGRLYAALVGPPELIPDPEGGPRYVRNPEALKWHESAIERESDPAEVRRRHSVAYLVAYRLMMGCLSTRDGFEAGERDGREAEYRRRAAARGGQVA